MLSSDFINDFNLKCIFFIFPRPKSVKIRIFTLKAKAKVVQMQGFGLLIHLISEEKKKLINLNHFRFIVFSCAENISSRQGAFRDRNKSIHIHTGYCGIRVQLFRPTSHNRINSSIIYISYSNGARFIGVWCLALHRKTINEKKTRRYIRTKQNDIHKNKKRNISFHNCYLFSVALSVGFLFSSQLLVSFVSRHLSASPSKRIDDGNIYVAFAPARVCVCECLHGLSERSVLNDTKVQCLNWI